MSEQLKLSWRNVPRLLKRILWFSVIGTVAILVLRLWPEQFSLGEEIGDLLSNICLAYLGGFMVTFLWSHFQALSEVARDARLRKSVLRFMAAGHNCFYDFIISGGGASPFDCEDYSQLSDEVLERMVRERWAALTQGMERDQIQAMSRTYLHGALDLFRQHFEDIDPFMAQLHPTFVLGLNRIRRELGEGIVVGENGVASEGHELTGPLMQFSSIRDHIRWLREVDDQVEKSSEHDFHGAIPQLSREELIARGVPVELLEREDP